MAQHPSWKDLLKQGLVKNIGNGETSKVWLDNWIMDPLPRAPQYHPEVTVDLTLRVFKLMEPASGN